MLFELGNSILGVDFDSDDAASVAVTNLVSSTIIGSHYLIGKRETLNFLTKQNLGRTTIKQIQRIEQGLAQSGEYFKRIKRRVLIDADIHNPIKHGLIWKIPLRYFSEYGVPKTLVLAENLLDVEVCHQAAKHYSVINKTTFFNLSFTPRGGGGSQIYNELSEIENAKSDICLSVTDSDKLSPAASTSDISQRCRQLCARSNWVVEHFELPAHEIENMVPTPIVEEALAGTPEFDKFNAIKSRSNIVGHDLYRYADLKKGKTLKDVKAMPSNSPNSVFWRQAADSLNIAMNLEYCDLDEPCNDETCKCIVMPGLGDALINKAIEILATNNPHKLVETSKDCFMMASWIALGEIFFEFCFAPRKDRM